MLKAILFNDTSYEKHHGSQLVVRQIISLAATAGIRIVQSCPMRYDWRQDERLKTAIGSVDLCLINGEGTFHDNHRQALLLTELGPYCKSLGVPCFLINSVWQRNDGRLLNDAKAFTDIYLRDTMSQQELLSQGLPSKVVPDLTLTYPYQPQQRKRAGIVVNGSVFPARVAEAWQLVCEEQHTGVRYLSIKSLPPVQRGKGFPRYFWKSIAQRLKSAYKRRVYRARKPEMHLPATDVGQLRWHTSSDCLTSFLDRLASATGVITGRFHCATLCLLTETPFFAVGSNTHKIEALLDAAGVRGRIYTNYRTAYAQRAAMAYSDEEQAALRVFVADCRVRAEEMFRQIAATARGEK